MGPNRLEKRLLITCVRTVDSIAIIAAVIKTSFFPFVDIFDLVSIFPLPLFHFLFLLHDFSGNKKVRGPIKATHRKTRCSDCCHTTFLTKSRNAKSGECVFTKSKNTFPDFVAIKLKGYVALLFYHSPTNKTIIFPYSLPFTFPFGMLKWCKKTGG